ncbi:unnamed protein product [Orchesella dallaii]|uniref:C-type lectin domain-containing protein n=1 Tax=Orchesella dallaii TaxID=48710 RepID=A0ABP1R144_9HEXA
MQIDKIPERMRSLTSCFGFILALIVCTTLAVPQSRNISPGQVHDRFIYFSDPSPTLRTRDEARTYCQNRGGNLAAIVTNRIYNILRATISVTGTYWIDGIEEAMDLKLLKYESNSTTNPVNYCGSVSFSPTVQSSSRRCLSLKLPSTALDLPAVELISCGTRARVLCATQLEDCPTTTTTTMAPNTASAPASASAPTG